MPKMTLNELKKTVAEILDEAKKKDKKAEKIKKIGAQTEAYGYYDEQHDFSTPLGAHNLYWQQGGVNWGPQTSRGSVVDNHAAGNPNSPSAANQMKESDEKALRSIVREVIENGLIDEKSAWAPFTKRQDPIFESSWDEAGYLFEAWYDNLKKSKKDDEPKKSKKETDYGPVKKHGFEKKSKK